jgi:glycosyltransferase 2 family protein
MNTKRILVSGAVVALLGLLIYLQVRTWKKFDWQTFWSRTDHVKLSYVLLAVALIYLQYVLRAVRWRIFLKPVCQATTTQLLAPTFIGFAGLALLGRPGEMIRPYLISRKMGLTFSSQVAVWLVERIFDMGSVAIMFVILAFVGDPSWSTLHIHGGRSLQAMLEWSAVVFVAGILALTAGAIILRLSGTAVANYLHRILQPYSAKIALAVQSKLLAFTDGLKTIHDLTSFLELLLVSVGMWSVVGTAYWLVIHSYGGRLAELGPASIILLMVASMFGSLIQLPGVGGGSQLACIAVLNNVFGIDNEISVSCGMLLWVATFMSVIPTGLALARREHLSIRAVAEAEEKAAALVE